MSFECPDCFSEYSSREAADRCAMWCGDDKPHPIHYRPKRWDDYDE